MPRSSRQQQVTKSFSLPTGYKEEKKLRQNNLLLHGTFSIFSRYHGPRFEKICGNCGRKGLCSELPIAKVKMKMMMGQNGKELTADSRKHSNTSNKK